MIKRIPIKCLIVVVEHFGILYKASKVSYDKSVWKWLVVCNLCVYKVRKGFLGRVRPTTLKRLVVAFSVIFHINEMHNDRLALCLHTVTAWYVMSCVCSMAYQCGQSTTAISGHSRIMISDVKATDNQKQTWLYDYHLTSETYVKGLDFHLRNRQWDHVPFKFSIQDTSAVRGSFVVHPDWLSESVDVTSSTSRRWKPWPWEFQGARTWSHPLPARHVRDLRQSAPTVPNINVTNGGRPFSRMQVSETKPNWRLSLRPPKETPLGPYGPRTAFRINNLVYPVQRSQSQYPLININNNNQMNGSDVSRLPRFSNNLRSSYLPSNEEMINLQRMRTSVAAPGWVMHRPLYAWDGRRQDETAIGK